MFFRKLRNTIALMFVLGMIPSFASAAAMSFTPSSGSHGVGKTFTVTVVAQAGTETFNSASGALTFDKEFLSVQSVSKNGSALSLWAVEPSSSNSAGTVSFEGGNTSALTGQRTLVTITFKALKEGKASVAVASGSILAADGKGTDILTEKGTASYDITPASAEPEPSPSPSSSSGGGGFNIPLPDLPIITSPTHPDEGKWSNAAKAKFVWDLPADVTVVRMSLDKTDNTIPTTAYDPAVADKEFDTLENGTMWFHLRYKNDGGWGPTVHRKVMIDKDPPPEFTLEAINPLEDGGKVTLKFNATDTLSGLDRYELSIDGGNPQKLALSEIKDGEFLLEGQSPGEHSVAVKAFDRATNGVEAETKFVIPGEVKTQASSNSEEEEKPTNWTLIWLIIMVALCAFLVGFIMFERKNFRHEKFITKRESDEVRDTVGNIFAALREEVGEQTGQLFQRPNPSAQDREVMMRINEAIDLSEELIAKEVEDVRKTLM